MRAEVDWEALREAAAEGRLVPYLGAGALEGVVDAEGRAIAADPAALAEVVADGRLLPAKVRGDEARAAMYVELKRGRGVLVRLVDRVYRDGQWRPTALYRWLAERRFPYVIDTNRDRLLIDAYADRPHTLVVGGARLVGRDERYRCYRYEGGSYREIAPSEVDEEWPILFKPLGAPLPRPEYVISEADFVDYFTELMGGLALPPFLKARREKSCYLVLGVRLVRDTERILLREILGGNAPQGGWLVCAGRLTAKEEKTIATLGLRRVEGELEQFVAEAESLM
ncbi:MAG: SIR2 family protein [Hydrogenophilus sp.]|nr:SIR2 family protein [Hydrogenophilus sp.]